MSRQKETDLVHFDAILPLVPPVVHGQVGGGYAELARRCGLSRRTLARYKRDGLIPFFQADRIVASLGEHPAVVWPETYGSEDIAWVQSIVMPGRCGCGARIALVKKPPKFGIDRVRFHWVDPTSRRPCKHPDLDGELSGAAPFGSDRVTT